MFKCIRVAVLLCMLAACGAPKPRPNAAPHPVQSPPPQVSPRTHVYRIDAAHSELRILVYRAGPLARLGHNHVMVNRALEGSVNLESPQSASSFSLRIPVADFVVDDPQSRSEEGVDFPGEIPDEAKSGTLRNMLSASLLHAADYPVITVDSTAVQGANGAFSGTLAIEVAGHESTIKAPFTLASDEQRLRAMGSMELRQSDLGLTPYSLMLGALQVQDMVRLKFSITAVAD
ncbi:MAG: YceI family protein [Pseudomonadota bacterium]|nr:YceI family protein [Pseudomonadota bacterium]